jgi:hypothetical protein
MCEPENLLLADIVNQKTGDGTVAASLSLLPFRGSWRASADDPSFSEVDLIEFLTPPPGRHIHLPLDIATGRTAYRGGLHAAASVTMRTVVGDIRC